MANGHLKRVVMTLSDNAIKEYNEAYLKGDRDKTAKILARKEAYLNGCTIKVVGDYAWTNKKGDRYFKLISCRNNMIEVILNFSHRFIQLPTSM